MVFSGQYVSPAYASDGAYALSEIWTGQNSSEQFNFPVDVFVDKDDRVLVADYVNNRIQIFNQNAQFLGQWTRFNHPEKIAQGSDGNFYIADTDNHRIVKLAKTGEVIDTWSDPLKNDFFPRGVGVAVSPDNFVYSVHAVDYVYKYDANGQLVSSWGSNGVLLVKGTLEAVRVDSKGFVYVLANDSVIKLTPAGEHVGVWGSFDGAQDLFIDQNDNIFITNTYKGRIEKYTTDGQLLSMFGMGILNVPHGAGVDRRGRVYVADARNNRVVVFTPSAPPPFILDAPLIKQTDPKWGNSDYDHAKSQQLSCGKTISECGCALTSLAMLLNYHGVTKDPDGNATSPATLNNYFNKNTQCVSSGCVSQGYAFGNVMWSAADRYSAEAHKTFGTQKIVSLNSTADTVWNPAIVAEDIKSNQPVIVKVKQNEHWALATGIDQNTFAINDPLIDVDRLNNSPYTNVAYAVRRFKKTTSDFSLLEVTTKAPTTVSVTDPLGRKTDTISNTRVSLAETSSGTNTITIGTPLAGEYKITVTSAAAAIPLAVYASNKEGGLKFKLYEQQNTSLAKRSLSYTFLYNPTSANEQLTLGAQIDIQPALKRNIAFCNDSSTIIPVAVLSSETFNARHIDSATVTFEGAKNILKHPRTKRPYYHVLDINDDGKPDAIFNFKARDTQLHCTAMKGTLAGKLKDGMHFEGSDTIRMVGKAKWVN